MKSSFLLTITLASLLPLAHAEPVSYYNDIRPIFKASCNGCHQPGKIKGGLDLTTHAALSKGGKTGALFSPGSPSGSLLLEEISGEEPSMPKDADPLTPDQVALIQRWILEGGKDDTPADKLNPYKLTEPPVYPAPAHISALAYSPDGETLAVSGYHEVLLHKSDGSEQLARLVGESPKIEAVAFSADGKMLAVSGGAPAVFGEVQFWSVPEKKQLSSHKISNDSLYGISLSPDNTLAAFGGADKSVRVIRVADGTEVMKFDNHSDWVFGTTFTVDGKRLLTGSRDKAMKLINIGNGQLIDDINKLLEGVLCISRHPKEDFILYGGEQGHARIYRISENQGRTAANNDVNMQRLFERYPGPIRAVAYSPDGSHVALGGSGNDEVRIYKTDGTRTATLKGHEGAVFTIVWHPAKPQIATGGLDGTIRIFDPSTGSLIHSFVPFPIQKSGRVASK